MRVDPNPQSSPKGKLSQSLQQPLQYGRGSAKLALPDDKRPPARLIQRLDHSLVSCSICQELGLPELRPRFGQHRESAPRVMMPEAPMYKDTDPQPRQYNVGFSRQILAMQPVTIAVGMQKPAHQHFRLRVLPSDTRHHSGSPGRLNDVHFEPFRYSVVS